MSETFNKDYFDGKNSIYTSSYDYKINNIKYLYYKKITPITNKKLKKQSKVLDVGCAFGNLLELLDKENFKTFGIDISEYAVDKAKKNTKANILIGDINKGLSYKDDFFDAVFAFDIIEHLISPFLFLQEINRILKKGGLLFLYTPNIDSIFEKILKKKWFGYIDKSHLLLFNRKSLKYLLDKTNFSIIKNETISFILPSTLRSIFKKTDLGGSIWMVAIKK